MKIGIIGSGTMGISIGHFMSLKDNPTIIYDNSKKTLKQAEENLHKLISKLEIKNKYSKDTVSRIKNNIKFSSQIKDLADSELIIEAIIEDLDAKKDVFSKIEKIVNKECIIASNTSSLSITALASSIEKNNRFIGLHFFNPANLMPLVEIIPAIQTSNDTIEKSRRPRTFSF